MKNENAEQPAQQECRCNQGQVCHVCDPIEQPAQQEPVAWMTQARNFIPLNEFTEEEAKLYGWNALYASPPAQQEPVAWVEGEEIYWHNAPDLNDWIRQNGRPLVYGDTSPQPAQRKPLTEKEIREWWASENGLEDCEMCKLDDFVQVVRAIEAAHGIKEKT